MTTPLQAKLVERIRAHGPMTFRDYMHACLYHPEHGYYATGRAWEGKGDFTTGPMYSDVLALAIARFAERLQRALGPGHFEVVEVGVGNGRLTSQLHALLRDTGMRLRAVEHRRPPALPRDVPWTASVRGLGEVRGLLVSNELFDALPVHRVLGTEHGLREVWVHEEEGVIVEREGPLSRAEVATYADRFRLRPAPGHAVEVGLDALAMLRDMAGALREGAVLTVDYGDTSEGLAGRGPAGTLAAWRQHRAAPLLDAPGAQDLTAHVNLTALREAGMEQGLVPVAEAPQWRFLGAMGALDGVAAQLQDPARFQDALAAKQLLAPGRMGDFRVLAQGKALPPGALRALGF